MGKKLWKIGLFDMCWGKANLETAVIHSFLNNLSAYRAK